MRSQLGSISFRALWTQTVELQLMVELLKAGLFLDLLLQGFHRAGNVEPLNAAALRADEVVVMMSGLQEGVIGTAVMQTEAADETQFLQLDQHTIDGGLVSAAAEIG